MWVRPVSSSLDRGEASGTYREVVMKGGKDTTVAFR